jgi:hypothetical protein
MRSTLWAAAAGVDGASTKARQVAAPLGRAVPASETIVSRYLVSRVAMTLIVVDTTTTPKR